MDELRAKLILETVRNKINARTDDYNSGLYSKEGQLNNVAVLGEYLIFNRDIVVEAINTLLGDPNAKQE